MTPEELRAEIPAVEDTVYLNTGASGPSPRRVVEAVESCLETHEYASPGREGMYGYAGEVYDAARERVADLLGCRPAEVALTGSTTDGINRVACAIDWGEGDRVVRTDLEHAAGVLPWERLREEGVRCDVVPTEAGRVDHETYDEAVEGARLVCLSALTWTHGTVLPVADLVERAHAAGAEVLVDAVQVPGQRPIDVREWGAEYVAAAGHKWLLGPWSAGYLYVDRDAVEGLRPRAAGYRSVRDGDEFAFHDDARRLEVGTESPAPHAGLVEAIDTMEAVGIAVIQDRVRRLTDRLKDGLGDRLVSPRDYESGLVTFTAEEPDALVERLADRGVVVRSLPTEHVRASVHAFNTTGDVDALLDGLWGRGRG